MATGKSGILGKLRGSLDGVTLYNLKGTQVIRKKAVQVHNPATPAQTAYRDNVKFAIQCFNQLKPFLQVSLANRPKKQSLLSEFLRLNINKSIVNETIDISKLVLSNSSMQPSQIAYNVEDLLAELTED